MKLVHILIFTVGSLVACEQNTGRASAVNAKWSGRPDSSIKVGRSDSLTAAARAPQDKKILTGRTKSETLVSFAESLIGTPYRYASSDPTRGFDCSGFITYVFNHFSIKVPRSSADFAMVERKIPLREAHRGDLILFTGTDSTRRDIGHMGIITSSEKGHHFIHSTSGKAYGVTVTPLNSYYQGRFVTAIRIFED